MHRIDNLVLVRLKQPELIKMKKLAIYVPTQLGSNGMFIEHSLIHLALILIFDRTAAGIHSIGTKDAKKTIEQYDLRHSTLVFQLVLVDDNNVAFPTDCLCQTAPMLEYEGKFF